MGKADPVLKPDVLQGEFVSTSRLEAIYSGNSSLIHQMYIYGSSLRSYLLAAVIPSPRKPHEACCIADGLFASRRPSLDVAQSVLERVSVCGSTATRIIFRLHAHVAAKSWHGLCSGDIAVQRSRAEEGSEARHR